MWTLWFARCEDADYAVVKGEIKKRDAEARIVRAVSSDLAESVLSARGARSCAAAAMVCAADKGVFDWMRALSAHEEVADVLALIAGDANDHVARAIDAGATEVMPVPGGGERANGSSGALVLRRDDCAPKAGPVDDSAWGSRETKGTTAEIHAGSGRGNSRELEVDAGSVACDGADPDDSGATGDEAHGAADKRDAVGADRGDKDASSDVPLEREELEAAYLAGKLYLDLELDEPAGDSAARSAAGGADSETPPWDTSRYPTSEGKALAVAVTGPRAPLVAGISGRGGVGKTTVLAAMAAAAARFGLRAAVVDLDLMFGNISLALGSDAPGDMSSLVGAASKGRLTEEDLMRCAVRAVPGVTVWGPIARPERAELMARPVEMLIDVLRREADVIFVDTSVFWGDAMAAVVAGCERCLVFGDSSPLSGESAARAIDLAARLGVPRTRMSSVYNKADARGSDEDRAMAFGLACSLSSRIRIAVDENVPRMLEYGRCDDLVAAEGAFAQSVRAATRELLSELGCSVGKWNGAVEGPLHEERPRLRLPWKKV